MKHYCAKPSGILLTSPIKLLSKHTHTKQKAKLTAAVTQLLPPSHNTGMPGTTQTLEPSTANPPAAGLVTHRRTVQVPQIAHR